MQLKYDFSLCYTSRRPLEISRVLKLWYDRATRPERVEALVAVDGDDPSSMKTIASIIEAKILPVAPKLIVQNTLPGDCVLGWNLAASISDGRVLMAIADDFVPPEHWDDALLSVQNGQWVHQDSLVHVHDGLEGGTIATLSIITRIRYDRFGYLFYPGYQSVFSDTEATERAKLDHAWVDARHIVFEHRHYQAKLPDGTTKRAKDEVDANHDNPQRWSAGEMLFNYRKVRGFPIDAGPLVRQYQDRSNISLDKFACYMQVIKDDFCLWEVCKRMMEEGIRHFFFSVPDEYWDGRKTPESDIKEVIAIAARLKDAGAIIQARLFAVAPYRHLPNRISIETSVRNEALQWIRSEGFNHILIVDGDELWKKGLMAKVNKVVSTEMPTVITTGMVPVVGLPGLPVANARDKVTIYIRADVQFYECRSPNGVAREIPGYLVYHFTCTRKSKEAIIEKMRASGHYDDPAYDFDGFINNTLNNIKVGMENVHFYKHFQIWPSIRKWTNEEWAEIPDSVRVSLAKEISEEPPAVDLDSIFVDDAESPKGFPKPAQPKVKRELKKL